MITTYRAYIKNCTYTHHTTTPYYETDNFCIVSDTGTTEILQYYLEFQLLPIYLINNKL